MSDKTDNPEDIAPEEPQWGAFGNPLIIKQMCEHFGIDPTKVIFKPWDEN